MECDGNWVHDNFLNMMTSKSELDKVSFSQWFSACLLMDNFCARKVINNTVG